MVTPGSFRILEVIWFCMCALPSAQLVLLCSGLVGIAAQLVASGVFWAVVQRIV